MLTIPSTSNTDSPNPLSGSNPPIGALDVPSIVRRSSFFRKCVLESYDTTQSRAMSGSTVDGDAESDQFLSVPGTPTAGSVPLPAPPHGSGSTSTPPSEPPGPMDGGKSSGKRRARFQGQELEPPPISEDFSLPVKGMYRLLDLITEQGSSGLGNYSFVFWSSSAHRCYS